LDVLEVGLIQEAGAIALKDVEYYFVKYLLAFPAVFEQVWFS
jgi:hypothetical protein